jgi:hypothetical protein
MDLSTPPTNALLVIQPYLSHGTWVFDDPAVGLVREPFVSGIPQMIDDAVKNIPNAQNGFRLIFSTGPFPGYQVELTLVREEYGGNWYREEGRNREGWLCPALFKYFSKAPQKIYAKGEALE